MVLYLALLQVLGQMHLEERLRLIWSVLDVCGCLTMTFFAREGKSLHRGSKGFPLAGEMRKIRACGKGNGRSFDSDVRKCANIFAQDDTGFRIGRERTDNGKC